MSVRRIYVEKEPPFAVRAKELLEEIKGYLGLDEVTGVRVLVRYDVENLSEETYRKALDTIFSEPPVDVYYEMDFPRQEREVFFSAEYLPGQFDQRADSAEQCVKLLKEDEAPVIRSATTYVLQGNITQEVLERVKNHCINPVDSREAEESIPSTLVTVFPEPADVAVLKGFSTMEEKTFRELYQSLNLAMTFRDFLHIQKYFMEEEKRDPSMTEIRVLDTYWSDHCRHTTFLTELTDITFEEGYFKDRMQQTFERYMADRDSLFAGRKDKFVCLMDLALIAMRILKKDGKLEDQEETDEINACSIVVPVTIDGKEEEWLVNFKNETHNHPTEIEPFGGAATCLGGAIRDPLSGRTYVYQAMRVTGAADPTKSMAETLKGKLPQKKIVRQAAQGYSSYGNQIGLATGYVQEIYHPDYVAKRMEIGAVMGAAPRSAVKRENSDPGDVIVLLGGRTGRDGLGGATGSSKVHTVESIETCGAEVQKGNAPTERKLQRLFKRPEVSHLIKKCNDFGAGGVSVAIGELAPGLEIQLDKVPKKYAGLDGTEIAISESQERMAVVLDPSDVEQFLAYAAEENLEATTVAEVTASPRLVMHWRGKTIVNISRAFLDTNGAHQEAVVSVVMPKAEENYFAPRKDAEKRENWLSLLSDLNVCSQKGLVEMFDGSIGAGSVLMPFGGKYQLTPTQTMVAKLPVAEGKTDVVTMMSFGFDPYLSAWSPYHGAVYAVVDSIAKIVAAGGDFSKIRMTFQEYFQRMTEDSRTWGQPFAALLGAYDAQMGFGLPSIGGKDSMSGTFNDIHVPPTLVSFAVDVATLDTIISPEWKGTGHELYYLHTEKDGDSLPDYETLMAMYRSLHESIRSGKILSAYAIGGHGLAESAFKMAIGNGIGAAFEEDVPEALFFTPGYGDLLIEVEGADAGWMPWARKVGETISMPVITWKNMTISLQEGEEAWKKPLEKVFPTRSGAQTDDFAPKLFKTKEIYVCRHQTAVPRVFIPVFPGTNCEYDSAKAFFRAGAQPDVRVFRNQTPQDIRDSVEVFERAIAQAQMIMFPGGFSAGDEPDGSAKFFATAFRNARLKEAIENLLNKRDGLVLGICNGFQALIKLGLVPYGHVQAQEPDSPTLTMNTIGRHISKMVYLQVTSDRSPWLQKAVLGGVYTNPASHGEGRFVASREWLEKLEANGQIATRYVDIDGNPANDEEWNVNGSYGAIEGITSPDGRVLGKMAHAERRGNGVAINIYGEQDLKIFESGVEYFR